MPAAFEIRNPAPAHLSVPENLIYDYMIYRLSKIFGISPKEAEIFSENDFWLYAGFDNLDEKRKQYYIENSQNKGS